VYSIKYIRDEATLITLSIVARRNCSSYYYIIPLGLRIKFSAYFRISSKFSRVRDLVRTGYFDGRKTNFGL